MKMPRIYTFDVPDFDDCGGRTTRRVEVPKRVFREIEADVAAPLEAALTTAQAEIEALRSALETAVNALAWAERRMACKEYAKVIANDERNARATLGAKH